MDDMTWWTYVERHAVGDTHATIGRKSGGLTGPSVGRWKSGSRPDPAAAAAFARSYGRPVLEAFIAAGYLTPEEAQQRPAAAPSMDDMSNAELAAEVLRRMEGGSDAGQAEAQKRALMALPPIDDIAAYAPGERERDRDPEH